MLVEQKRLIFCLFVYLSVDQVNYEFILPLPYISSINYVREKSITILSSVINSIALHLPTKKHGKKILKMNFCI